MALLETHSLEHRRWCSPGIGCAGLLDFLTVKSLHASSLTFCTSTWDIWDSEFVCIKGYLFLRIKGQSTRSSVYFSC